MRSCKDRRLWPVPSRSSGVTVTIALYLDSIGSRASDIYAQIGADVSLVFYGEFRSEFFYKFINVFFLWAKYETIVHM